MPDTRAALRQLLLLLAVVAPLAAAAFLSTAGFFDAYEGYALGHRPLKGSDGQGDAVRRFVLEDDAGHDVEVALPVAPFAPYTLPYAAGGVPPVQRPEGPPMVVKERFSTTLVVDGRRWSLLNPAQLWIPLVMILGAVAIRNVVFTGSAFRLVPEPGPPPDAPDAPDKPRRDSPKDVRRRLGMGPPPRAGGRKRKRGRR
ncbi:MAG: hypothetical protein H6739_40735 [Alphaproteobacteria bacterium]|nr:hypothetical protein [Alphaproteobacteria bacterium]